jgi:hypothetical protein
VLYTIGPILTAGVVTIASPGAALLGAWVSNPESYLARS